MMYFFSPRYFMPPILGFRPGEKRLGDEDKQPRTMESQVVLVGDKLRVLSVPCDGLRRVEEDH